MKCYPLNIFPSGVLKTLQPTQINHRYFFLQKLNILPSKMGFKRFYGIFTLLRILIIYPKLQSIGCQSNAWSSIKTATNTKRKKNTFVKFSTSITWFKWKLFFGSSLLITFLSYFLKLPSVSQKKKNEK